MPGELALPAEPPVRAVANLFNGRLATRPAKIEASSNQSFYFYDLKWKTFGGPVAHASGIANFREGCRNCRHKVTRRIPATLRLKHLVARPTGFRVYALLRYTLVGPIPPGFNRHGVVEMLDRE